MQFQTPQFIEVEDKIFARLTFKQAIYIGGGGGMAFTAFYFIPFKINRIKITQRQTGFLRPISLKPGHLILKYVVRINLTTNLVFRNTDNFDKPF